MAILHKNCILGVACLILMTGSACATGHKKPCSEGGQLAREGNPVFHGTKRCYQAKDKFGKYLNDGKYFEWNLDDQIMLEGEYALGKKTGRWIEYDEDRKVISDKYFQDGKEVDAP